MSLAADQLGSFGAFATAIGLMRDGTANTAWFGDPVGRVGNVPGETYAPGLRTVLADDTQRDALTAFVDEALGPPDREAREQATWVPIFAESDPDVTLYAVLEPRPGTVRLGVGITYTSGTGVPRVTTRAHVPIFQMERREGTLEPGDPTTPDWLLLGGPHGSIEVALEAVLDEDTPTPGDASLGGVSLSATLPTAADGDLSFTLDLLRLQLPGAAAPRDLSLGVDDLDDLGGDVLDLLVGLVRAQADALDLTDPDLRPFAALTGLLGLRAVPGIPAFPLAELTTAGIDAVVGWVRDLLGADASRDAWLGELAALLGGTADAPNDAVRFALGAAEVMLGVRVDPGVSGLPVLVPWVEVGADTGGGSRGRVEAAADLLRLDTGTGSTSPVPALRAEAVLGVDAGGPALLAGDPGVGSLRVGIAVAGGRPAFTLLLGDVVLNGRTHDLLDLSSPEAARDAAEGVVEAAVAAALAGLGPAGDAIAAILGVDAPSGVTGIDVVALLADPLAALAEYWTALTGVGDAMRTVLGQVQELLTGVAVAQVPGNGTVAEPWHVDLGGSAALHVTHESGELRVALASDTVRDVLGDHEVVATVAVELARVRLDHLSADFVTSARGELRLRRDDATPLRVDLADLAVRAEYVAAAVTWSAGAGISLALDAPELLVSTTGIGDAPGLDVPVPLPHVGPDGSLTFVPSAWGDVEDALVALLGRLESPTAVALLDLLGWRVDGPRLSIGDLVAHPGEALAAWLADLVLDCDRVRDALVPLAALVSAFRGELRGQGTPALPFRCPVGGDARAPGLAVWLDPGCPPPPDPAGFDTQQLRRPEPVEATEVVAVVAAAGETLAPLGDLLVGRDGLAAGLDLLRDRWTGSDGVVTPPATVPDGVATVVLPDATYDELVAFGAAGGLLFDVLDPVPSAVVHVGCEPVWTTDRAAGTSFDLTASDTSGPLPATGDGEWTVRLPDPAFAAAARPDRGGVAEQAARLAAVLAARTDPVTVVAYGAAAAAAVRATTDASAIEQVVTVGAPWGPVSSETFATGLGGDALRLLDLLRAPTAAEDPVVLDVEADPGRRLARVVERSVAALLSAGRPPSAADETPRAAVRLTAVFGDLDQDAVARGIAGVVADGIDSRLAAATSEVAGPVTSVHAGVGLPALDLDLGGLLVGAGATLELVAATRDSGGGLTVGRQRQVVVDLHLGVHDGWLVGGPGSAQHDLELRWMSARVEVPLDGGVGRTTLTLHESTAFGVTRERWVVGPAELGADEAVSTVLPELRALLAQVAHRLQDEAADAAAVLEALGLLRDGGLDPGSLDLWVLDTARAARESLTVRASAVAGALRTLIGDTVTLGSGLVWTTADTSIAVDLAAGTVTGSVAVGGVGALPALSVDLAAGPGGADVSVALGTVDADRGGLRLTARGGTAGAAEVAIEVAAAGASPTRVALFPRADADGLVRVAATLVPSGLATRLLDDLRNRVDAPDRLVLEEALDLLGLLGDAEPGGVRRTLEPIGLFLDPVAWLRHGVARWRTGFAGSAVELLDRVGELVAPGTDGRWEVTPELAVTYAGVTGGGLRLGVAYSQTIAAGGSEVATTLSGGLVVPASGPAAAFADTTITIDGHGARLLVDPGVRLDLVRPAPRANVTLYPGGAGIGDIAAAAGGLVAPVVLNALADHRADPGSSLTIDAARVLHDLGGALDLLEADQFTAARLQAFAADPAAALAARLPQVAASGLTRLADALDPAGTLVRATEPATGQTRFDVGVAAAALTVLVDGTGSTPAVELGVDVDLGAVGHLVVERLRLSPAGVRLDVRVGPAPVQVGPVTVFPLLVVRAGLDAADFTRTVGLGLATDGGGATSAEFRWGLDASPPQLRLVTRADGVEHVVEDAAAAALPLLGAAASLATGVLLAELDELLSSRVTAWLRGVVFLDAAGSPSVDPALFTDLLDADAVLDRVLRLAWNLATESPPSLTIDGTVTVALVAGAPAAGSRSLGINLALDPLTRYRIVEGDTQVDLVVDADWIDPKPPPGLTIDLLRGTSTSLQFVPEVTVAGIGLRVSRSAVPLLDLGGVAVEAVEVHTFAQATATGQVGGGVQLRLDGLAFSPAAGGGDNQVANSLMTDAGAAGEADRPSLSPALSVQQHPGSSSQVGFRAGQLPGPWFVVVQRQLGPLYVEQVGLDTVEADGRVTRISLLFDGRVSLFGLEAAVDQLSLNWNGGDVLALESWSVDLMGLAVSADLSGAYLSGGLLKTEIDGDIGYVGMLLGRFGVYGLSVFGGYTDDDGSPSFFVFGAVNGPIGGPPAFFLTGIGGGLGINRALRAPTDLARFGEYPFIKALDPAAQPSDDPMGELRKLNAYFPPERGNFWFAAGISFTSFALIDGVAVVSVSFGTGFEINILGLARLALPRPQAALVSIELGLLVRFSTTEGLFLMQAQLTDNSWLLYEEVRLTGGFAMAMWWKGALAGQFVVSLGGYHPEFQPPSGYPVVPRLGLEWRISDEIVVKGGSYFALTSEAVMAGVDVELSANWGWAWVRVAFGAHAIVFFDPFFYRAMAYARISAGIRIKIWFATVSFSISIGARIEVQGPDFSGKATFEIGPCELSVGFGNSHKEKAAPLTWSEFVPKYLEDAGGDRARALSGITGRGTRPAATGGEVSAPSSDGTAEHPYEVFAEFEISFVTAVPVTSFRAGSRRADVQPTLSDGTVSTLGIAPMGLESATTTLEVRLERFDTTLGRYVADSDGRLDALADGLAVAGSAVTGPHVRTDSFPLGVWGPAEDEEQKPIPRGEVVRVGNSLTLVAGFSSATVGPEIDYRQVTAGRRPLPLLVSETARVQLLATAGAVTVASPTTASAALTAARTLIFGGPATSSTPGLLDRGEHGAVAAAAFAGDRVAPPLFGTLAGGIRAESADRATTTPLDPSSPPTGRTVRTPTVVGLLAAGSGVLAAPARTTVADGRRKRRAAPSVDSVRSRLGDELPIRIDRPAAPAQPLKGTLVVGSYPRTDLAGVAASHVGRRLGSPHLDALVGGLTSGPAPRADRGASTIRSGDLLVLERTDATIDVGDARPTVRVDGAARVVMLRSGGAVAVDTEVTDDAVEVPPRVRLIAVQADGELDVGDGLPGWHARSRLGRVGSGAAVGPGCTVSSDAASPRRRTGWVSGRELVERATTVTTHLARPATFVAVVLDGDVATGTLPMGVELRGARRVTDAAGSEVAPTVVLAGAQSVLLVPVVVDGESFDVVVHSGGEWQLGGVLAGSGDLDQVADLLAEQGVDGAAARLLAVSGAGCRATWGEPGGSRRSSPRRARKSTSTRKSPARKTTTRKSGGGARRPRRGGQD